MTEAAQYQGEWKAEAPACREVLEFLRAAANDPGVSDREFGGIVDQMLKAGTMPDRIVHPDGSGFSVQFLLGMGGDEDLRHVLRDTTPEPRVKPPLEKLYAPPSEDEQMHDGDEEDDDPSGPGPGMTLGDEDRAWSDMLASLDDAQMGKLMEGLVRLNEETKARTEAERRTNTAKGGKK